jgi:hypothetical protein
MAVTATPIRSRTDKHTVEAFTRGSLENKPARGVQRHRKLLIRLDFG